jgi:hypothetical protein
MCVQPSALALKAIQYMVLYCLTPGLFHRYSCLNLCPPFPAQDGNSLGIKLNAYFAEGKGIRLVNSSVSTGTDNWPRLCEGVYVA